MAALSKRAGHYIFALQFFFLLSFFFYRLTSAIADWMSTILPHMMWPYCEFRMQVWNVLHAARWKYRTQKSAKIRHLGTIAQLCPTVSSQLRHVSTIGKNLLNSNMSSTCSHNMANFSPLTAEISSGVCGTPANFNEFRVSPSLLQRHRSTDLNQTMHDVWPLPVLVHYTYIYTFSGALAP